MSEIASANICVSRTLHVLRIHGHVTDQLGRDIPGAKITLKKAEKTVLEFFADDSGSFRFKTPSGNYDLIVQFPGFERGWTELNVGFGPKTWFRPNTLYIALAVGSLYCPPKITTSYREYKKQIRAYEAELEEHKQEHATQK
jgi:hypothetical protein